MMKMDEWLIQRGVADDKAEATPMEAACRARPGGRAGQ